MDYLLLGEKITINRSDGRVHTAQVISKYSELKSVLVSWREGFKMMGKQLSWDCVMALNPQLEDRNKTDHDAEKENIENIEISSEDEFFELEPRCDEMGL